MAFEEFLRGLDAAELTALLERRPDVLVEPAPRSFAELAHRLNATESLGRQLDASNADELTVIRTIALGGTRVGELADRLGASNGDVRDAVDALAGRGLAWRLGEQIGLHERLAEAFTTDLERFPPLTWIARITRADDLRVAVTGLGGDPTGLRKAELVTRLTALCGDSGRLDRVVGALPPAALAHLMLACEAGTVDLDMLGRVTGPVADLVAHGLVIRTQSGAPVLAQEVVATLHRGGTRGGLRGRPALPAADGAPDPGRAGADAALLALTTLLDEARHRPLAGLKKGGIGTRECTRLAAKVGVAEPALWIDVAAAGGLLERTATGYAASAGYAAWREESTAHRWATTALTWYALEQAPTARQTDDGEVPPPEPVESAAGMVRRALLRAAAGGRSVRAAAAEIAWFCPLHPYTAEALERAVAAACHEAELLGVLAGDRLTTAGEHLVTAAERPDTAGALATAVADLLPEPRSLLVLQSDLTAVVSGRPSAAAARLLADALDRARDVRIAYRNRAGNRSVRTIRPEDLYDRWVSSWCHLRGAQREFAVAGIESVAPAG